MENDEIIDRIIDNAFRLAKLSVYYDKLSRGIPMEFEQEQMAQKYKSLLEYQQKLIAKLR